MRIAGNADAPVPVEVVVDPVPVQIPPLAIVVEIRIVPVTIGVHHVCAKSRPFHCPLKILKYSQDCIVFGILNSLTLRTK